MRLGFGGAAAAAAAAPLHRSVVRRRSSVPPMMYMYFTMQPGSQLYQPIPDGWNAFVYIINGEGVFGREKASPVSAHHCVVLGPGDGLSVWNRSGEPLRFALAVGQPLNEPVVQQGPFVMNTRAEIQQAMEDYC